METETKGRNESIGGRVNVNLDEFNDLSLKLASTKFFIDHKETNMDEFHGDSLVLCDILSRLDVRSLMRLKSVSKPWRSLIEKNSHLVNLHLTQLEKRGYGDLDTALFISQFHYVHRNALSQKPVHPNDESEETKTNWYCAGYLLPNRQSGSEEVLACDPYLSYFPVEETVLEPVYGLICCASNGGVRISNPITGETTSWIYTRAHEAAMAGQQVQGPELEDKPEAEAKETTSSVDFMFAFGYDPIMKQHKVLCVSRSLCQNDDYYLYYGVGCEVMTVGENTWRIIDDDKVPPTMAISKSGKSVYVNGSIYWMCDDEVSEVYKSSENKLIIVFNVCNETFKEILIPNYVRENLVQTMVLGEIDGKIAIAACHRKGIYYDYIRFWIYENVNDHEQQQHEMTANINYTTDTSTSYHVSGGKWIKEDIPFPRGDRVSFVHCFSFKAIAGTGIIVVSLPRSPNSEVDYLYYHDRRTHTCTKKQLDGVIHASNPPKCCHGITTFFGTLSPVKKLT